jgi:hypothetical protein
LGRGGFVLPDAREDRHGQQERTPTYGVHHAKRNVEPVAVASAEHVFESAVERSEARKARAGREQHVRMFIEKRIERIAA